MPYPVTRLPFLFALGLAVSLMSSCAEDEASQSVCRVNCGPSAPNGPDVAAVPQFASDLNHSAMPPRTPSDAGPTPDDVLVASDLADTLALDDSFTSADPGSAKDDGKLSDLNHPSDTGPSAPEDTGSSCPEGSLCTLDGEEGTCSNGHCVFACGDGLLQVANGETCDDGNTLSADGCREDCITEESIGAGFTGGQCQSDSDCSPAGSVCIPDLGGGSCAIPCTALCDDEPGSPVTFCIAAEAYAAGMSDALAPELSPALCVSKCDFERFPRTGCRAGFHGELQPRYNQLVEDEVCVPGPWHRGLALNAAGDQVIGLEADAPEPAQPYMKLLGQTCGLQFEPVNAELFEALATTLLAMGSDGQSHNWQRLCTAPSNLPNPYNLHAQVSTGQAYRITGSRTDIVDWSAAGLYGSKQAQGELVGGPLYPVRTMVYADSSHYLYADAADDHPHYDPERGRTFGIFNGDEWGPLDAVLEPEWDYTVIKANGGGRFYRAWGRRDVLDYTAGMCIDHLLTHGELLGVGDISLPTGGDIDDHSSHELGRDVDLYLVTHHATTMSSLLGPTPWLWVSDCSYWQGWDCVYWENASGVVEDLSDPAHVPGHELLSTLAWHVYDNPGPTWFVQHDVSVLEPFNALPGPNLIYVHADNDSTLGWPPHQNHIHLRFPF